MKLLSKTYLLDSGTTVTVKYDGTGHPCDVEWPPGDKKLSLDWILRVAQLARQEAPETFAVCVDHGVHFEVKCPGCLKAPPASNKRSVAQGLPEDLHILSQNPEMR